MDTENEVAETETMASSQEENTDSIPPKPKHQHTCTPEEEANIFLKPRVMKTSIYSPHRRIIKAAKRQATLKRSPMKFFRQHNCLASNDQPSPSTSTVNPTTTSTATKYPESFTKGMVTVRKIETLMDPKRIENLNATSSSFATTSRTQITYLPRANGTPIPVSKVFYRPVKASPQSNVVKVTPPPPKVLGPPVRKFGLTTPLANSPSPSIQASPPPKIVSAGNNIRLTKLGNGSYRFEKTSKQPPETFQNAFLGSSSMIKLVEQKTIRPNTTLSKQHLKTLDSEDDSSNDTTLKDDTSSKLMQNPPNQLVRKNFQGNMSASPRKTTVGRMTSIATKSTHDNLQITILKNSYKEVAPEPFKYSIPQNMLASETDKAVVIPPESSCFKRDIVTSNYNNGDLFVVENEPEEDKEDEASNFLQNRNRRKSTIVPKVDDNEFNQEHIKLPRRPQANVDLIETLAKYRVMIRSLLQKINVPQIDFSEDSDDYINIYKIFKN